MEQRRLKRQKDKELRELRRQRVLRAARKASVALLAVLSVVVCGRLFFSADAEPAKGEEPESSAANSMTSSMAASGAGRAAIQAAAEPQPAPEATQLGDPLLVLVNGETPLPEDWTVELTPVSEDSQEMIDVRAYDDLHAMTEAARKDDVWFWVTSGYRSIELQQDILERKVQENESQGMSREDAEQDALRTIQRPGYSEHHTGLVVDFNDASDNFEETDCYYWLEEHAAEYGFVQRYKQSKAAITGIDNESWHYRYVGKLYAQEMERLDMCLEEYVSYLKEASAP